MAPPLETSPMTRADFLAWEATQVCRHEFCHGEVFAMTGARQIHVIAAGNCFALLKAHLRGTGCRAYIADMQLEVAPADAVFYPDVFVTCAPEDLEAERVLSQPKIIIEVLSDSTAAFDRGGKFAAYRMLPSLQEYVLVDPDLRTVEVFRRTEGGDWLLAMRESARALVLQSIGFEASLAAVFEDVGEAPAPESRAVE